MSPDDPVIDPSPEEEAVQTILDDAIDRPLTAIERERIALVVSDLANRAYADRECPDCLSRGIEQEPA